LQPVSTKISNLCRIQPGRSRRMCPFWSIWCANPKLSVVVITEIGLPWKKWTGTSCSKWLTCCMPKCYRFGCYRTT
jgi:hypothetical protein